MSEVNDLYEAAQRMVVGSLLYDGSDAKRVLEIISYEDFADTSMEQIFFAIRTLSSNDTPINIQTVAYELERNGNFSSVGGMEALYLLSTEGEDYALQNEVEYHARVVKEFSAKHGAKATIEEMAESLEPDSGATAAEAISNIQSALNEKLMSLADEASTTHISEYVKDYEQILEERRQRTKDNEELADGLQGIPSLLPTMNKYTSGWRPGQLITVAARTGVGKTVFAIMEAVAAASAGKSVMFFSLEMGRGAIVDRVIACMSGVSINKLKHGTLDAEEKEDLNKALERLKTMKIKIDTDERLTADSIRARCYRQAQSENGLDMVILDYLQLVTPTGRHGSRQESIADISRNMKMTARGLGVPIMVLAQLNRASRGESDEEDKMPRLDDIRESGSIAMDSDVVILLHREPSMDGSIPKTVIILAKNRDGESQKYIHCHSNLPCSRFDEVRKDDMEDLQDDDLEDFDTDIDSDDIDEIGSVDFEEEDWGL